jgi:hypothetical protein
MLMKANVEQGMENRKATPSTANNWLKAVRYLFDWCIAEKKYGITVNPTLGVKPLETPYTDGITAWTEADVEAFISRWPAGTMEHRALMVLLERSAADGCRDLRLAYVRGRHARF